jgi:hypothetical protein
VSHSSAFREFFTPLQGLQIDAPRRVTLHYKVSIDKFTGQSRALLGLLDVPMNQYPDSIHLLSNKPSAFIPISISMSISMSLAALTLLLGGIAVGVVVREADEGAIAHIWQLLMAGQLPLLAYFVIR